MPSRLQQRVFEVRFDRGYLYLDRCGEIMRNLEQVLGMDTARVWVPGEMVPTGARLECPEVDCVIVLNSSRLVIDQNPINESLTFDFPEVCETILSHVIVPMRIGPSEIRRVGSRSMRLYGADNVEAANRLSIRHALMTNHASGLVPVDHKLRSVEQTLIIENDDETEGMRIRTMPFQKVTAEVRADPRLSTPPRLLPKGQHDALVERMRRHQKTLSNPEAGLLLDVDYYKIEPGEFRPKDFLSEAREKTNTIQAIIEAGL